MFSHCEVLSEKDVPEIHAYLRTQCSQVFNPKPFKKFCLISFSLLNQSDAMLTNLMMYQAIVAGCDGVVPTPTVPGELLLLACTSCMLCLLSLLSSHIRCQT